MPLRAECFRELNSRKHVARSAVSSLLAWLVQDDHTANKLLENIPHEEVFRGCTIIGIFFDSCIAKRDKQIDMKSCLSEASSLNDYDNRTSGLRAQDVFAPFFVSFLSVMKEMKNPVQGGTLQNEISPLRSR